MTNLSKSNPSTLQFTNNSVRAKERLVTMRYEDLMILLGSIIQPRTEDDYKQMLHNVVNCYNGIDKINEVLLQEMTRVKLCTEIAAYEKANSEEYF